MKKLLLTGIAALFLATGAAHATGADECAIVKKTRDGFLNVRAAPTNCSGVRVELLKFQVHDYQLRIDGQFDVTPRVNIKGLKDGTITFNGKRCKQTDEPEDWVEK
jgi:hypothetical protein